MQSSRTNVSVGETVGLKKHLKRKLYVWARKEKEGDTARYNCNDEIPLGLLLL